MPGLRILRADALHLLATDLVDRFDSLAIEGLNGHILTATYAILKTPGTVYQDLGAEYFEQRNRQAIVRRATRRQEALGYRVTVEEVAATAS